jgi:ATP-dependent helicase/nuclease subunit A
MPPQKERRETPVLINKQDLQGFKSEINCLISESAHPTYIELSVSDIISEEPLHTVKGGLGPEWGSAIHEIIESLVRDETTYNACKTMILQQYGFNEPKYEKKAEELISKFKENELYSRIQNAEMKLAEVPFSIKLDTDDPICGLLGMKNPLPVILQGKIDLAIKENGAWSIIDYKTNYFETEDDLNLLINHYTKQIRLYCRIWERITKEKVTGGELYFTGTGCSVIVNI